MTFLARVLATSALVAFAALGGCGRSVVAATPAEVSAPLNLTGSVTIPGYKGDFDHFAADVKGGRLYLAGEDGNALEVFDVASGQLVQSIGGQGTPHSPFVLRGGREVLVVEGDAPSPVFDTRTLKVTRTISLPAGADSAAFDPATGHIWVVTGGKDVPLPDSHLVEVDPMTGKTFNDVHIDANHVEALAIERNGDRLFINVTDKNTLLQINKRTGKVVATWPIHEAQQNAPLDMDEATHRLFVVTRKPGMTVVVNADTGASVASFKAPERTDQVIWDAANRRAYVLGGEGYISVIQQDDADHYREIAKVPSAPGAKTGVLVPSLSRLYVAASPGDSGAPGKVLWYAVAPR
jgi:DNA-binding beta-propeller fold protein YncE